MRREADDMGAGHQRARGYLRILALVLIVVFLLLATIDASRHHGAHGKPSTTSRLFPTAG
jgi:hypothetical protein